MNAHVPAAVSQIAPAPAADAAGSAGAFTSITIWASNDYFLQVHYGYFDSWEDAEDFASVGTLSLEERSNALFLVGPHGSAFIPDQSMTIFRNYNNSYGGTGTYGMTFDDLMEVADMGDMRLTAIGSLPVVRGRPIIARPLSTWDTNPVPAANDDVR